MDIKNASLEITKNTSVALIGASGGRQDDGCRPDARNTAATGGNSHNRWDRSEKVHEVVA